MHLFKPAAAIVWDCLIGLLLVLEMLFLFYFYKAGIDSIGFNEIGFFASSALIGVALACKYYGKHVQVVDTGKRRSTWLQFLPLLLLSTGVAFFFFDCAELFRQRPVTPFSSDIIPTVQIAVRRFLHGQQVYAPVVFPGWSFPMTYLPMQWMPYVTAEWIGCDYRWVAIGILCLAAFIVVFRVSRISTVHGIAATAFFLLWLNLLITRDPGILAQSVECMVAGYYMLFITGIGGRSPWWRAVFISLCLLSRFSLVLWLPLWAFVELAVRKDWNAFWKTALGIVILVGALYVIPFLSHDWGYFFRSVKAYTGAALGEWTRLNDNNQPNQLYIGVGFARLFYEKLNTYSLPDRIASLQKVHLAGCLGVLLIMGIWYWMTRKRLQPKIFLLASFKVYMAVFLCFIQVPYTYLMMTTVAISIAIFAELPRYGVAAVRKTLI